MEVEPIYCFGRCGKGPNVRLAPGREFFSEVKDQDLQVATLDPGRPREVRQSMPKTWRAQRVSLFQLFVRDTFLLFGLSEQQTWPCTELHASSGEVPCGLDYIDDVWF